MSTAQARSAGGQRHFRPPGARYHAPITMRASAPGQVGYCTTVASHVRVKTIQVSPNLGQDSEKLGDVSKCPKTYRATSCKRSCNELQEDCVRCLFVSYYLSLGSKRRQPRRPFVLLTRLCFEQTSCSDRRHRRAAVRALSLQDRPGLQPIWPGSLAGWRSLGSDCLRRRARPAGASRAGRSSHGLGAPDVPT